MSSLDQAFIRAFQKDAARVQNQRASHSVPPTSQVASGSQPAAQANPTPVAQPGQPPAIENQNSAAAWYRADQPIARTNNPGWPISPAQFPSTPAVHGHPHVAGVAGYAPAAPMVPPAPTVPNDPQPVAIPHPPSPNAVPTFHYGSTAPIAGQQAVWFPPPTLHVLPPQVPTEPPQPVVEPPQTKLRLDAGQVDAVPPPHIKKPSVSESAPSNEESTKVDPPTSEVDDEPKPNSEEKKQPVSLSSLADAIGEAQQDFNPAWEVDRVAWPGICDHLIDNHGELIAAVGKQLLLAATGGHNIVAIASCRRAEGRTSLAMSLARWAAIDGSHILLVDADFQDPQIATRLRLNVPQGWQDAICEDLPLTETAVNSVEDQLALLPASLDRLKSEITLTDSRVAKRLRPIATTFDLVLVDIGPLAGVDFGNESDDQIWPFDKVLFVRDVRHTLQDEVDDVIDRLAKAGIETIGQVENFDDEDRVSPLH